LCQKNQGAFGQPALRPAAAIRAACKKISTGDKTYPMNQGTIVECSDVTPMNPFLFANESLLDYWFFG
jgi:hypothetical protein